MPDIKLTVGVDTQASLGEFVAGVRSLIASVNTNDFKIKVGIDPSSLNTMKSQLRALTNGVGGSSGSSILGAGFTQSASGIWLKQSQDIQKAVKAKKADAKQSDVLTQSTTKYISSLKKLDSLRSKTTKASTWTAAKKSSSGKDAYNNIIEQQAAIESLYNELNTGKMKAEDFQKKYNEIAGSVSSSIKILQEKGLNTNTFGEKIAGGLKKYMQYFGSAQIIAKGYQVAKQMVNEAIDIESAMAQIQIVTGAADSTMSAFFAKSTSLAKELGQSITDVAGSIETFARLGYSMSDSSTLAKYANMMANVGATDVDTSTTGITSIIKGYGMDVSQAEHVSDVLISVGQNYAISAEELMQAFQRGGAAMAASGTDFEKTAALFAATNASLQNASTVGTLWKTNYCLYV
nr:MAG TPA: minor tail protein [Caudoviricetes sp.]